MVGATKLVPEVVVDEPEPDEPDELDEPDEAGADEDDDPEEAVEAEEAALLDDELEDDELELDEPLLELHAVSTSAPAAARETAATRKVVDLLTELITPIL